MQKLILILLFFSLGLSAFSQGTVAERKRLAKESFYHSRYKDALNMLTSTPELSRDDKESRFLIALCNYQLNKLDDCINQLNAMVEEERSPYPECWLYLGKAYHARHQFDEAAIYYKLYLKTIKGDHPNRRMVHQDIRRCANGLNLQFTPPNAVVENMGPGVNSDNDEFAPVPSPNFYEKIYFSAVRPGSTGGLRNQYGAYDERLGHYFTDIYSTQIINGRWGSIKQMDHLINSPQHEILLDFSRSGSAMYYFKGWNLKQGEIQVDSFRSADERVLSSDPFVGPLNPVFGDGTPYFAGDTLVFFSSSRPGGYGGLDLYRSVLRNGKWSPAENLGPQINTEYDETTPFMARDGKTLYFSSNNSKKSIGGFDVFKATYVAEIQLWSEPLNVGLPINSAGNDAYFRLATDGFTGFFSSSRKDGYGKRDLYIAYFSDYQKEQDPPASAFVPPPVSPPVPIPEPPPFVLPEPAIASPEPPAAVIPATDNNALVFNNENDLLTGINLQLIQQVQNAMLADPALQVVVSCYGPAQADVGGPLFETIRQAEQVSQYLLANGVSASNIFMRALVEVAVSPEFGMRSGMYTLEFSFHKAFSKPDDSFPSLGDEFNSVRPGLVTNESLFYKVQIASAQNVFRNSTLSSAPYPMVEKTPDFAFYRFTVGAFNNYAEAEQFRRQMVRQGFSSAFVIPYIYGQRADKQTVRQQSGIFPDLNYFLRRG